MHKDKDTFLEHACEQVRYQPIRESLRKELDDHIEDRELEYRREGLTKEEAEERAVKQMGDPVAIGVEFHRLHHLRFSIPMLLAFIVMGAISTVTKFSSYVTVDGDPVSIWRLLAINFIDRFDFWIGLLVFMFVAFFGYYLLGKHRVISAIVVLIVVPFLANATGISWFTTHRVLDIYPILTVPFLATLLYRYRSRCCLAFSLYGMGIACVITLSLWIKPLDYTLITQHLIACYLVLVATCMRGWYHTKPKRMTGIITLIFACILIIGTLTLPYAKAEVKMLFGVNTQDRTVEISPYDGIVVRDLLSKSRVFSGLSMSKEEMLAYKSAKYMRYDTLENERIVKEDDYGGISLSYERYMKNLSPLQPLTIETISAESLMPMYSDSFYPIATLIITYGWWTGILICLCIFASFGYLLYISLHMKNKFAFILSFSSSVFLVIQGIGSLLMNFGFSFSRPIEFPFSYMFWLINLSDAFLLGLIFTAYRYDRVKLQS